MTGWVKSLQCKSKAADDVVQHNLLPASTSCRFTSLSDVIETTAKKTTKKIPKPKKPTHYPNPPIQTKPASQTHPLSPTRRPRAAEHPFPALTELPEGHPSRNIIEIIFHQSWSTTKTGQHCNPVRVEMVFKVQNPTRIVTRFEEYRERVKSTTSFVSNGGACEAHARCLFDGNEVMRFYSMGPAARGKGGLDCGGAWGWQGGKGAGICTFSGAGEAHGGAWGRRAMMVCRVVAGRVGSDSVSGEKGELVVFDTRAVLPCFLIIYKV